MDKKYDLIVIGAGPGGYVSAAAAAGKGMKTAIVEKEYLGGTCLNHGCIPTKTIMHSSEIYREMKSCEKVGISVENISCSMEKIQQHKQNVTETLRKGIAGMLKKGRVDVYTGKARITEPNTVEIEAEAENEVLQAENILICTGSSPAVLPVPGIGLPNVVTSDELLDSDILYKRLVIIGGGVIGMEFASIYNALGTEVTVIEALDRILANMDKEFSQSLRMLSKKRGIDIHTSSLVKEIRKGDGGNLICVYEEKEKQLEAEADCILVATGRCANTEGLFGEHIDVAMEKGKILVDENFRTNIPGIYAAGDVIGGIQLAHAASAEAINAVCHMNGEPFAKNTQVIPACVYTNPEIASAGITADEAKKLGINVVSAKYPMSANGKSMLSGQERGFIKVIAEAETGKILGAQMMCAGATDMIGVFSEGLSNGLTAGQMAAAVFPHPTFSEGIAEALELLLEKL